jgi:formylmethanofuran dehydrogenase subunit E
MKDLLKQTVQACINEDMVAARSFYAQYFELKSKSILEGTNKLVKGHCDACDEPSTTSQAILDSGKWECGKCEAKKFDADEVVEESLKSDLSK